MSRARAPFSCELAFAAFAAFAVAGCGSVELPEERFYRLAYPSPGGGAMLRGPSLRVERLELAAHLAGDRLLVAEGPVLLRPYHFHRWAGSLEGLVADALVTGLVRSGAFAQVRGPVEPGTAALSLSGRVLELQQVVQGARGEQWLGRAVLDLELADAQTNRALFRDEFRADVAVRERTPEAVVTALSDALASVVDQLLDRAGHAGVFASDLGAGPGR